MAVARYTDRFLNALMDSHRVYVLVQLWYDDALVGALNLVSGSVSADRSSSIRRTAGLVVDPSAVDDPILGPKLHPFGSMVKIWRGVRYADNTVKSEQVFTGRIDAVERSLEGVTLRCSDLAARVLDCRFTSPYQTASDVNVNDEAERLIKAAWPVASPPTVLEDTTTAVTTVGGIIFEQERGDALDYLTKMAGVEWFADSTGVFHLRAMPAVVSASTMPVWLIDSGDSGVLVTSVVGVDRQNVANWVVVESEPVGGVTPAHGEWKDENDQSVTYVDGPYGVVTGFFSGQAVNTTIAAEELAATLGANSIAKSEQVQVSCVPNPRLNVGDVVRVHSASRKIDKMYFIQTLDLPLDPDSPMSMTLYQTLTAAGTGATGSTLYLPSPLRLPEGCTWQPHP